MRKDKTKVLKIVMMILLGVLFLMLVPFLMGIVINEIGRKRETNQIETYLSGFFFLFFVQGVVFFGGITFHLSFGQTVLAMSGISLLLSFLGVLLIIWKRKKYFEKITLFKEIVRSPQERGLCFSFLLILVAQIFSIVRFMPNVRDDIMLETVITTITTDTMYQYHPLTGALMELGMIGSKKIITLPLWYSYLSEVFQITPAITIYVFGTIFTLLLSYCAFGCVFHAFLLKNRHKVLMALNFLGLLYLAGDYYVMAMGYRQLYYGYTGEVICVSVMIPYLIYTMYHKGQNYFLIVIKVLLCLFASIFIAPLGTGAVHLILVVCVLLLIDFIIAVRRKRECK